MKILVAYYSQTGNTKKLAETIARKLNCDIDPISDKTDRKGILGWILAGRDAFFKRLTHIEHQKKPADYDLVAIGSPVWAGTMAPAVRRYLSNNKCGTVAFFCTYRGSAGKTFAEMEKLSAVPRAYLGLKAGRIADSNDKIDEFCDALSK
ncbi:MAG: hypothetical protein JXN60_01485 [Lentisphaerae bacterium]|nr:hypothetical protein [Lentisphaerota bacterium]